LTVDPELSVEVNIDIYEAPVGFLHISVFRGECDNDRRDEMDAIDALLENLKGHSDTTDIGKKLKARKEQLLGSNTRKLFYK